jgi:hypothetical protein
LKKLRPNWKKWESRRRPGKKDEQVRIEIHHRPGRGQPAAAQAEYTQRGYGCLFTATIQRKAVIGSEKSSEKGSEKILIMLKAQKELIMDLLGELETVLEGGK